MVTAVCLLITGNAVYNYNTNHSIHPLYVKESPHVTCGTLGELSLHIIPCYIYMISICLCVYVNYVLLYKKLLVNFIKL